MSNQKFYENVLKFKDLDNRSYEVNVQVDDLVIDIKKKLSKNINKDYTNIILMFKNEILFDDKLISEYNIVFNQFVLWFEGDDCAQYSNDDSDIIKCITIIDNYNDDEYFVNMNKSSTVRMLKSIITKKYGLNEEEFYLEFNKINLSIDEYKSLEQCGLSDGCKANLVQANREFGSETNSYLRNKTCNDEDRRIGRVFYVDSMSLVTYDLSLIPLTNGYKSFKIPFIYVLNDLIKEISFKNNDYASIVNSSLISLYSDAKKNNKIRNDLDLQDLHNSNFHGKQITIYYEFISKLEELEKKETLGKGSFGKVYKCRNKNTNQIFALKKFDLSENLLIKDKFQREVDCYLKLKSHIRIIKYENHFIEKHKSYILMEYMDRGSLGRFVQHNDLLSEPKIAKYALQILEGLEYLHYNQILHRDLKGDNILLNENDDLKLCDFGLAKILTDISSGDFLNGVVQSTVGTANWQSPEIINGEKCGSASDIWSFGATMVEIITRKRPFGNSAIGIIVKNIQAGDLKFDYPSNSSDDMKSFIGSCLKRNPKERASIKNLYESGFIKTNM